MELFTHGGEIVITGEPEKVDLAKLTFEKLVEILLRGENVDRTRIRYAIELAAEGKADRIGEIMRARHRHHLPRAAGEVQDAGAEAVRRGHPLEHLLLCRRPGRHGQDVSRHRHGGGRHEEQGDRKDHPHAPRGRGRRKAGLFARRLAQKVDPYLRPLYDALHEMLGVDAYQRLVERGAIEVAPLAYMRGRTLNDAFIILDEAQNTTSEQMKMFLTRMGMGSKMVITGDVTQIDLPAGKKSGLVEALEVLKNVEDIGRRSPDASRRRAPRAGTGHRPGL